MRDRVERFVVLPLSIGCNSESSIALGKDGNNQVKKPSHEEPKTARRRENTEEISSSSSSSSSSSAVVKKKKNAFISFLTLPKRNISGGIKRLIKSIKSFSQIFVYKEEGFEEPEKEMEIGFPTDVKHVTHIGLDGSTTTNPVKGIGMGMGMAWENLNNPPEVLSFPTISLKQFELAMAAQSDLHHDNHQSPLVVDLNDIVKDNLKKA